LSEPQKERPAEAGLGFLVSDGRAGHYLPPRDLSWRPMLLSEP
jgi:hypothetical protein